MTEEQKQLQWEHWLKETIHYTNNGEEKRLNQLLAPVFESCSYQDQTISMIYKIDEWELNPRGELHGGTIAAMFDLSLGVAARCASASPQVATTDMTVSYLCRVDGDDTIHLQTKIQKAGKLMIRISAEARSEKTGKVVATAQGSYMVLHI